MSVTNWNRFSSNAGFSMVELLIVLAIIGLLASLAVPALLRFGGSQSVEQSSDVVRGKLAEARNRAIATGRLQFVRLDFGNRTLTGAKGEIVTLSPSLNYRLVTAQELAQVDTGSITFNPNGGSSGGSVMISGSDGTPNLKIAVHWLTGTITVSEEEDNAR